VISYNLLIITIIIIIIIIIIIQLTPDKSTLLGKSKKWFELSGFLVIEGKNNI